MRCGACVCLHLHIIVVHIYIIIGTGISSWTSAALSFLIARTPFFRDASTCHHVILHFLRGSLCLRPLACSSGPFLNVLWPCGPLVFRVPLRCVQALRCLLPSPFRAPCFLLMARCCDLLHGGFCWLYFQLRRATPTDQVSGAPIRYICSIAILRCGFLDHLFV